MRSPVLLNLFPEGSDYRKGCQKVMDESCEEIRATYLYGLIEKEKYITDSERTANGFHVQKNIRLNTIMIAGLSKAFSGLNL